VSIDSGAHVCEFRVCEYRGGALVFRSAQRTQSSATDAVLVVSCYNAKQQLGRETIHLCDGFYVAINTECQQ